MKSRRKRTRLGFETDREARPGLKTGMDFRSKVKTGVKEIEFLKQGPAYKKEISDFTVRVGNISLLQRFLFSTFTSSHLNFHLLL